MQTANLAAFLTLALGCPAVAHAAEPAPPPSASVPAQPGANTSFHDLMANPKSAAVLRENIPMILEALDAGYFPDSATLGQTAASPEAQTVGGFTPAIYAKLLSELDKL
jgi:hypothetical protein